ncbi:MAG: 16S rRNA (cytosine(1402)-N(4))-methyltransferase RsmH [bacterium]|nr:16S rRNA (cytosine(1402)-N(4))-methyltransferase RsmH [bacterium]
MPHLTVLLHEAIDNLNLKEGDIFVDGTLGGGGHSSLVAERFGEDVEIIGLDRDIDALEKSEERLRTFTSSLYLKQQSFRNIDTALSELGIKKVNAILLDLGLSSDQFEESGRGFTFQKDEPLLMTMDKDEKDFTAKVIVNSFDEDALELIIRGFGEEKFSRKIARKIVEIREVAPIETTFDLVNAVRAATPAAYNRGRLHPATRTFQAIRIAVNEELTALEEGLEKGFKLLENNGRFGIISFHSLEDRIVKNFFRDKVKEGVGKFITKKPLIPTDDEIVNNPRARSAKLRVIEKINSNNLEII